MVALNAGTASRAHGEWTSDPKRTGVAGKEYGVAVAGSRQLQLLGYPGGVVVCGKSTAPTEPLVRITTTVSGAWIVHASEHDSCDNPHDWQPTPARTKGTTKRPRAVQFN